MSLHLISSGRRNCASDSAEVQPDFLTEREVCRKLGVGITTLRRWRWEGREMPKSVRLGRLVRYHRDEVEAWIRSVVSGNVRAGSRQTTQAR